MEKKPSNESSRKNQFATATAIGLMIGAAIGVALNNIAVGAGIGLVLGAAIGAGMDGQSKRKDKSDGGKPE